MTDIGLEIRSNFDGMIVRLEKWQVGSNDPKTLGPAVVRWEGMKGSYLRVMTDRKMYDQFGNPCKLSDRQLRWLASIEKQVTEFLFGGKDETESVVDAGERSRAAEW